MKQLNQFHLGGMMEENAVYISYSRDDSFIASQLVYDLEQSGVTVWYDNNLLTAGKDWRVSLDTAISECKVLVWILTENSMKSDFVAHEISLSRQLQKTIVPLMFNRGYAGQSLEQFELTQIHTPSILTLADYQKAIDEISDLVHPDIQSMTNILNERGFSQQFTSVMRRMIKHPDKVRSDHMVLHYSESLTLEQLLEVETTINDIFWELLSDTDDFLALNQLRTDQSKIMVVDSHDHTGSTDVVMAISNFVAGILDDPIMQALLVGLATNAIYDLLKKKVDDSIVALRDTGVDVTEDIDIGISPSTARRLEKTTEKITQNNRFLVFGSRRLVWGTEQRTTKTTYHIIV